MERSVKGKAARRYLMIIALLTAAVLLAACGGAADRTPEKVDLEGDWYVSPHFEVRQGEYQPEDLAFVIKDGSSGFIDADGNEVIPCDYSGEMSFDKCGLAIAEKGSRIGVINTSGEEIVPLEFDHISNLYDGTGLISASRDSKYGFIALDGGDGIPFCFDDTRSYPGSEYGAVSINDKWGVISRDKEITVPIMYDDIDIPYKGYVVVDIDEKEGLLKATGEEILPAEYNTVEVIPMGDQIQVVTYKDNNCVLYDQEGNQIKDFGDVTLVCDYDYDEGTCGIFAVNRDGSRGFDGAAPFTFYDHEGNSLSDSEYTYFYDLGKIVIVETEEWCGLLAADGSEILPLEYDYDFIISRPDGGDLTAFYKYDSGWSVMDEDGKRIEGYEWLEDAVDVMDNFEMEMPAEDRLLISYWDDYQEEHEGLVSGDLYDLKGNKINGDDLRVVSESFKGNVFIVRDGDGQYGIMDKDGRLLVPCTYYSIVTADDLIGRCYSARKNEDSTRATYFNDQGKQISDDEEFDDPRSYEEE